MDSRRTQSEPPRTAAFPQIAPISLKDGVINALKDALLEGRLRPGQAIVERDVAQQMNVGTPVVREALISLEGQGFVRRVPNTGTYVTEFSTDEIRQLYQLRVELESLALHWARERVTDDDLAELTRLVDQVVKAGERGDKKVFLERDFAFHRLCWKLSGNRFLAETLERLMTPLFVFVVMASGAPLTAAMGKEHYELIRALRELKGKEFTTVVNQTLQGFASRWLNVTAAQTAPPPQSKVTRSASRKPAARNGSRRRGSSE
jgi:DNA-binding GntR family transcriptional regulator